MSPCVVRPRCTVVVAFALCVASVLTSSAPGVEETGTSPPASSTRVDFVRDVQPILAKNCLSCHGPSKRQGGLRLDEKTRAFAGGDSGPAFEPGMSGESLLIEYVAGLDPDTVMPPKGDRLTPGEVGVLRGWIDQGASWPDGATLAPASAAKPGGDHWAFRAPSRPNLPAVRGQAWVRNPIDAFVLAGLEANGVEPSPEADRATVIRRLSLDLLGLPPSPTEVRAFLQDSHPDAYERLVDRLLASPHYGERWGRHWLDLARYADSDGYEKDSPRPHAWRYRNWVIEALNRDLPFDRFTTEQLAGDLLPGAGMEEKTATGFHRNTLTNKEGGIDKEEFRVAAVVDRVNTTATVWLGLTVGCAQCHTHKYDPILHKEYYQLFAFFNSAEEQDLLAPLPREMEVYQKALTRYKAEREPLVQAVAASHRASDPYSGSLARTLAERAVKKPEYSGSKVQTLVERPRPRATHIHLRGDFLRKGEEVRSGTLEALHPLEPSGASPNRLDLSRWLTNPANPLTARVTVNRVWRNLFGRGLVASLDDFGTRGELPSHPELLDWLATEFIARGWSQKAMIRMIVTSSTYRQSSNARPDLADRDAGNLWLARQNRLRLEAEVLRDVTLAAGGLLNPTIGGPSVRPPQPSGISELTYASSAKWVESKGADRYRRGLYTWFQRTSPYPMLMTFDAPDSNVCAVRRERSNTPLQSLTLLNDPVFFECAQALGRRVVEESGSEGVEGRIRFAFDVCLAREPSDEELTLLGRLWGDLERQCRSQPEAAAKLVGPHLSAGVDVSEAAAWVALGRTILNLDEFVTRE